MALNVKDEVVSSLFKCLQENPNLHSRENSVYIVLQNLLSNYIEHTSLVSVENAIFNMGPIGNIYFPFTKMGAISSLDLFGLDEFIIYSFYEKNRNIYKRVSDLGANIGLHSLILSRLGYSVVSYEPDPEHISLMERNFSLNDVTNIKIIKKAVSTKVGNAEFTKVLGNSTSSHLSGAKENPFGELKKFQVEITPLSDILRSSDLIKMDIEGHEAAAIASTNSEDWANCDAILEVGTFENSKEIYNFLLKNNLNSFSQKKGWSKVLSINDLPSSYKEGSLFITNKNIMPW